MWNTKEREAAKDINENKYKPWNECNFPNIRWKLKLIYRWGKCMYIAGRRKEKRGGNKKKEKNLEKIQRKFTCVIKNTYPQYIVFFCILTIFLFIYFRKFLIWFSNIQFKFSDGCAERCFVLFSFSFSSPSLKSQAWLFFTRRREKKKIIVFLQFNEIFLKDPSKFS